MSCPDWHRLVAARERDPLVDPPGWGAARAHLAHCASCRVEALTLDPTLLFARIAPGPAGDEQRGEVAAMQQSVAALIRASRVSGRPSARRRDDERRRFAALPRSAAAALLIFAGLAMQPAPSPEESLPFRAALAGSREVAELPAQPLIDELDLTQARVYELGSNDVAVVMVVDSTLDV